VRLLRELGYRDVRHYPGGLVEWFEHVAEHPIVDTPSRSAVLDARHPQLPAAANVSLMRSASTRFIDALGERSVGALFRLWLEIVVACGLAYWTLAWFDRAALRDAGGGIGTDVRGLLSAVYFSAVTATSVGYGDIVPSGLARILAILESIAGLILFGSVVSKFVSRRQDAVIAEIHYIAFEERLGRVRTNLLLVRAELQATARLCEGQDLAPREALARVESAAMVFVGELQSVHDLLYRPQRTPEESVLEAILAGLTSVFREFLDLLICVKQQRADRSQALAASLAAMSRLAREICGDCVPREFAPSLRMWMDEIQRIAGEVEHL
jgi:potassium channel LctB